MISNVSILDKTDIDPNSVEFHALQAIMGGASQSGARVMTEEGSS